MNNELAKRGLKPEILAQQRQVLRAFDLVYTPSGALAMVTEVNDYSKTGMKDSPNGKMKPTYSIDYIDKHNTRKLNQHNAWWDREDLDLIGNIIPNIAESMCHPFGSNQRATHETWEESLKV